MMSTSSKFYGHVSICLKSIHVQQQQQQQKTLEKSKQKVQ